MKTHTNNFKEQIKKFGRQIDSRITFGNTVLGKNDLNAVTPSYQGAILKSVMKQLDIDSNVSIPIGTILKYEFGLKVNGEYEYINYGNYVVYSIEKQEDTNSYKIVCYDKLLYSMLDYVKLPITYPISIRDYINAISTALGLKFANKSGTFANYNKQIQSDLYDGLGYTFRDVLDELAQVTASTICLNNNDELEIRYINETGDTIDEEFLKDVNVSFGEKYGKINSIVLSRSGETDNVYLRDETSVAQNGLCELKIIDNQIMNFNNRDEFLPDILGKINGLEFYINDFLSTGIVYYDLCDRYSVKIGNNTYSCVMFNDEVLVTQGLEENVYTEKPQETETDYTKADKTDRKINQTYLIVDKQNQQIEAVVSQTDEQNQKIAKVTQTVDELNSKISDIADITISGEDTDAQVELDNINESEPIRLVIRPVGESISYDYPHEDYPQEDFSKARTIRFTNTKNEEVFDYILPTDLLYYDSEHYDEFILDYEGQTCMVNKRVGYNADGTTYALDSEQIIECEEYPRILLTEGDYKVQVLGYDTAYIFVRLMAQNIYTTQFYTKAETDSIISQTSQNIDLSVNQKLSNYSTTTEMNSAIQLNSSSIKSEVNATIDGVEKDITAQLELKVDTDKLVTEINASADEITLTGNRLVVEADNFQLDKNGNMVCTNANIIGGNITLSDGGNPNSVPKMKIYSTNNSNEYSVIGSKNIDMVGEDYAIMLRSILGMPRIIVADYSGVENVSTNITAHNISTPELIQTSRVENKKNFELYNNALDEIKKIDIYKYNLKFEEDNHKKHIGFIIGKNYNYSSEITAIDEKGKEIGVDNYSMTSLCLQAIKEQQEIIEQLKQEISSLKESDN